MSLKPYPEYRCSGIMWLDEVPKHWLIQPATAISRVLTSTVDKKSYEGQIPIRLCNYTDVYYNDVILENPEYMAATATPEQIELFTPRAGDVAITKDSETSNDIGIPSYVPLDIPGVVFGYHLAIFRPADKQYGRFLKYLFESKYVKVSFETKTPGVTRVGLSQNTLKYLRVPTPPVQEAQAIANYLDRETAEIDAFVADQEELIALLSERRTATISQAVSKGIDPKSRMKDSNVSNLGLIPAHWSLTRIKHFTLKITDGAHISPETDGGIYDFVSTRDVSDSGIDFEGSLKTSTETYEYMVKTGCRPQDNDVLFSKDGTVGRTVVVHGNHDFVVASSLIIIRPDPSKLDPAFLHFLCRSAFIQEQVRSFVKGAGLPRLSIANLLRVIGVFPPLNEQQEIAAYLDRETAEIDAAIADAREAIALSKERRAAVISAAVTGKIDVRGLVGSAASDVEGVSVGVA